MPEARVVAAFSTMPCEVLSGVYDAKRRIRRPSLVCCGDDAIGKSVAAKLIRDAGFDPVDTGGLRIARDVELVALRIDELTYGGAGGPALAHRFERLAQQRA